MAQRRPNLDGLPPRDVTLTVFMEGTGNPMYEVTTQIALFSRLCRAAELPDDGGQVFKTPGHYKLSFDGCGVAYGFRGLVFAHGLREQCAVVRTHVEAFLAEGLTVTLNFVGLSRGGIGGLYLAQELEDLDKSKVLVNMLLFDPVPGNLVWMARIDLLGQMNANKAMDISSVKNLGRVLVLYPYEALPALAVHAPLLPKFPEGCDLEQDVILGCHQGALFLRRAPDTCLSFARIRDFLVECGTQLDTSQAARFGLELSDNDLEEMLVKELRRNAPASRFAHSHIPGMHIMRYSDGKILNRSHEKLLARLQRQWPDNSSQPRQAAMRQYMLDVEDP